MREISSQLLPITIYLIYVDTRILCEQGEGIDDIDLFKQVHIAEPLPASLGFSCEVTCSAVLLSNLAAADFRWASKACPESTPTASSP